METKKKSKLFWWILSILFIFYISYYIALQNGYYEYKVHEDVAMTEEQIVAFENDVKNGKKIDVNNYLTEKKTVTNNGLSKIGLEFSTKSEELMSKGINNFIKIISYLFKT